MHRGFRLVISRLPMFILAMLLTGCAATIQYAPLPDQTKSVEDPAKGRIYVMRTAKMFADGVPLEVQTVDHHLGTFAGLMGSLGPNGFLCWETLPGVIQVGKNSKRKSKPGVINSVPLEIVAGKVYYVRAAAHPAVINGVNSSLQILGDEEGRELLKHCHPPETRGPTPARVVPPANP